MEKASLYYFERLPLGSRTQEINSTANGTEEVVGKAVAASPIVESISLFLSFDGDALSLPYYPRLLVSKDQPSLRFGYMNLFLSITSDSSTYDLCCKFVRLNPHRNRMAMLCNFEVTGRILSSSWGLTIDFS